MNGKKIENVPYQPEVDPATKHLPNPSFWPLILAAGITCIASGFFFEDHGLIVSMSGVASH